MTRTEKAVAAFGSVIAVTLLYLWQWSLLMALLVRAGPSAGVRRGAGPPQATATRADVPVGLVHAAVDGDWLGVHGLAVDTAHRRQGIATALMAAVLEFGAERGAATLWLHVETDNDSARAFYEQLGLARHHTCRYLSLAA